MMTVKIIAITIAAIATLSCNSAKQSTKEIPVISTEISSTTMQNQATIENTKWIITKLDGADVTNGEQDRENIYFILDPDGNRINGFSGCNRFMGTYKIENGTQITFSQLGSTRMACPGAKINESDVLNIFNSADNFTIVNGELALNKGKRSPLATFKREVLINEPIVEKYWKLKTLDGKSVTMTKNQEREVYFTLKNDNSIKGFAGCNYINGQYTLEKCNRIRFTNVLSTLKACQDNDSIEGEFLKIFELVDNYTITDDELSLNIGRRAPLAVFEAVYF